MPLKGVEYSAGRKKGSGGANKLIVLGGHARSRTATGVAEAVLAGGFYFPAHKIRHIFSEMYF